MISSVNQIPVRAFLTKSSEIVVQLSQGIEVLKSHKAKLRPHKMIRKLKA